jgi:peroxiredoxin-like protein
MTDHRHDPYLSAQIILPETITMDTTEKQQKETRKILFKTQLNWLSNQKGILSADDAEGPIHVATPAAFGGEGKEWSPEHLFLGAITSCFMTTFLFFAKKFELKISEFGCNSVGRVELVEGKYQFTNIDVYAKIDVASEAYTEKAELVLEKAERYCLISNSISATVIYHTEVTTDHDEKAVKSKQ